MLSALDIDRKVFADRAATPPGALEHVAPQLVLPAATKRRSRRQSAAYEVSKRLMDCALASILIWIAVPTIAVCAILIKLDSRGPVFFFQDRTGKGGRRFRLCKLRTMVVDADELKQELQKFNKLSYPDFKMENDPRITRIGNFLRRTSLDELPNLFNIFAGHMSFVGPRPTSFAAETYKPWQTARLSVLPGITGLWQVSGRSDIDFDDRVRLDIQYIRNRSFLFDMRLLARTLGAVTRRTGAY